MNRTLSREQVFVPEGNSNSSPSGAVGDHQWTTASCTSFGREESERSFMAYALSLGPVAQQRTIKATQRVKWVDPFAKSITFAGALKLTDRVPCPSLSIPRPALSQFEMPWRVCF
jgi:hypothetical protein